MMAFSDNNRGGLFYIDTIVNMFFAIDMVLMFFTAYLDDDSLDIEDRKMVNYIIFEFI